MTREEKMVDQEYFEKEGIALDNITDGFCESCGERLVTYLSYKGTTPYNGDDPDEYTTNHNHGSDYCDECVVENTEDIE